MIILKFYIFILGLQLKTILILFCTRFGVNLQFILCLKEPFLSSLLLSQHSSDLLMLIPVQVLVLQPIKAANLDDRNKASILSSRSIDPILAILALVLILSIFESICEHVPL